MHVLGFDLDSATLLSPLHWVSTQWASCEAICEYQSEV